MKPFLVLFILLITMAVMPSCAYKLRSGAESLPGEVKRIQIPLFKNDSREPGAEIYYTNSLKQEALRSRTAHIENNEADADAILQGTITSINVLADESVADTQTSSAYPYLPDGSVLALQYK